MSKAGWPSLLFLQTLVPWVGISCFPAHWSKLVFMLMAEKESTNRNTQCFPILSLSPLLMSMAQSGSYWVEHLRWVHNGKMLQKYLGLCLHLPQRLHYSRSPCFISRSQVYSYMGTQNVHDFVVLELQNYALVKNESQ